MTPECLAEALVQQCPACFWLIGKDLVFRKVYGDTAPVFGKPAGALAGHSLQEVLPAELAAAWKDRVGRAIGGEDFSLRERRGESSCYVSVFPVRVDGAILYAGGSSRDETHFGRAEQELRNTVLSALKAQEFERNTLSKFLHDRVGQNFTALGLQLDLIRMDLEGSTEICQRISEIQKVLGDMMEEVREYSYALNPSIVERIGLRAAMDRLAARFQGRFAGQVRLNVDPSLKLDKRIASAIYRIAEEAVENSIQHSSCSTVEIAVKSTRSGTTLEIKDNGRGFDPKDLSGSGRGLGLLTMEHYAAEAGLDLNVSSSRGAGTAVRAVYSEI